MESLLEQKGTICGLTTAAVERGVHPGSPAPAISWPLFHRRNEVMMRPVLQASGRFVVGGRMIRRNVAQPDSERYVPLMSCLLQSFCMSKYPSGALGVDDLKSGGVSKVSRYISQKPVIPMLVADALFHSLMSRMPLRAEKELLPCKQAAVQVRMKQLRTMVKKTGGWCTWFLIDDAVCRMVVKVIRQGSTGNRYGT